MKILFVLVTIFSSFSTFAADEVSGLKNQFEDSALTQLSYKIPDFIELYNGSFPENPIVSFEIAPIFGTSQMNFYAQLKNDRVVYFQNVEMNVHYLSEAEIAVHSIQGELVIGANITPFSKAASEEKIFFPAYYEPGLKLTGILPK